MPFLPTRFELLLLPLLLTACGAIGQLMPGSSDPKDTEPKRLIANATAVSVGDIVCERKEIRTDKGEPQTECTYRQFVRVKAGGLEKQGDRLCADADDGISAETQGTLILRESDDSFLNFIPLRDLTP